MGRVAVLVLLLVAPTLPSAAQDRLQGDPEAVERVELMLERLGGQEVWARTRSLYLVYNGWRTDPDQPVIETAWRDLTRPRQRMEFEGRTFKVVRALSEDGGWMSRNGELTPIDPDELRADLEFWPYDFYTIIRGFAVADPNLRLSFEPPRRVVVRSATGEDRGWWEIDSTGQPVRWGAYYEDEKLEYVYLPVKEFGNINFPAGGAATDGFWRWEYDVVDASPDPLPVSLDPPLEE